MLKKLSKKYSKYLSMYKIYAISSIIIFVIFGGMDTNSIYQRLLISSLLIATCAVFYKLFDIGLRKQSLKCTWDRKKKVINNELTFFFIFGCLSLLIGVLSIVVIPNEIPFIMVYSSISLGLILTVLRNKSIYIYENHNNE